jgi:hypothetical protein
MHLKLAAERRFFLYAATSRVSGWRRRHSGRGAPHAFPAADTSEFNVTTKDSVGALCGEQCDAGAAAPPFPAAGAGGKMQ